MKRGSTYGQNRSVLTGALSRRENVTTSGSLRAHKRTGSSVKAVPHFGSLNMDERQRLMRDVAEHGVTYVAWSYDTPIAWVKGNGEVYNVEQRFSVTTSRHQGIVRVYL